MIYLNSHSQKLQSMIHSYEKITDRRRSMKCCWSLNSQHTDQWILRFISSQQSQLWKSENWYKDFILTYYLHECRWSRISNEQNQHKECLRCAKIQVQEEAADDWETIFDRVC